MIALVKHAPGAGNLELREIPEPYPGQGEVKLIETHLKGINAHEGKPMQPSFR